MRTHLIFDGGRRAAVLLATLVTAVAACERPAPPVDTSPRAKVEALASALAVTPTPQALLVVGSTTLVAGDAALSARLSNLGFAVTVVAGSTTTAADATGKAVVVISESVTDTQVTTKFKSVAVPVVVLEPLIFDDMAMTSTTLNTNFGTKTGQTQVAIVTAGDSLAAGLTGTVTVTTSAQTFGWGQPATAGDKGANIAGSSTQTALFGYRTGATMASSFVAPARRVGFFASAAAVAVFNSNGWALLDNAVKWATSEAVLVTNSTTLTTGETALKTRLEGTTLRLSVTVQTASTVAAANVAPARLVIVSDSASASTLGTKLTTLAVPVLSMQFGAFGNLQMTGTTSGTDFGTNTTQTKLDVVKAGHPLAGGLTGTGLTFTTTSQTYGWGSSITTGAVKVVSIAGSSGRAAVFGYPKGAALKTGTAAARRVGFGLPNAAFAGTVPAANAWTLFDAAVKWTMDTSVDSACESKVDGTACNDGNACTQSDTCVNQVCVGANPKTCTASDQCHTVGVCDPASGTCSNPAATNGTTCNDGNSCTRTDSCQAGVCTGGNPVVCTASDQCHDVGVCSPTTGTCSDPAKTNGAACNDSNACTQNETCQSGVCGGGTTVTCTASDQCHTAGTCSPATGCSNPAKANGAACSDGNACTQTDTCQSGACTGGNPVSCTAQDQCHDVGTCNPATGTCSNPSKANGSTCSDGNACTQTDTCQSGACTGANPVTCTAVDACHPAGVCGSSSGTCSAPPPVSSCGTITFYADFQPANAAASISGTAPAPNPYPLGAVIQSPGLFGAAVSSMGPSLGWPQGGNIDLTQPGSLSFWIKPSQWPSDNNRAQVSVDDGPRTLVIQSWTGRMEAQIFDSSQSAPVRTPAGQGNTTGWGTDSNWHLVVTNWTTNSIAISVDGQPQTVASLPWLPSVPATHGGWMSLAQYGNAPGYVLDEVIVLNRPMTDREIAWTYSTRTTVSTSNPAINLFAGQPPDGAPCDDGNACTENEVYHSGVCGGGGPSPNGTACNDGNVCTLTDTCQSGSCQGSGDASNDGNPCTTDSCNSGTGVMTHTPVGGACSPTIQIQPRTYQGSICIGSDGTRCVTGGQAASFSLTAGSYTIRTSFAVSDDHVTHDAGVLTVAANGALSGDASLLRSFDVSASAISARTADVVTDFSGFKGQLFWYQVAQMFGPSATTSLLCGRNYALMGGINLDLNDTSGWTSPLGYGVRVADDCSGVSLDAGGTDRTFTVDAADHHIVRAKVTPVTVNFSGIQGYLVWYGVDQVTGPTATTLLLTGRRFGLLAGAAYSLEDHTGWLSPRNYGVGVNVDGTISLDPGGTDRYFVSTGSTLTAKTTQVTVTRNGYAGDVCINGLACAPTTPTSTMTLWPVRGYAFAGAGNLIINSSYQCAPNSLTFGGVSVGFQCQANCAGLPDGTSCGDADDCNGIETCSAGVCAHSAAPASCTTPPVSFTAPPGPPAMAATPLVGPVFSGTMPGTLGVSPSGAATYTVPIEIPPGAGGFAPSLALNYNSQGRDGIAGQGWDLSGLSVIHRCDKTRAQDEIADFNGALCLDGMRLFAKTGLPAGEYFTESEQFIRVHDLSPASAPFSAGFAVVTKKGEIRYYGTLTKSRISTASSVVSGPIPVVWLLDRVTDAWGNYFGITYNEEGQGDFLQRGIEVSRIDYTGHYDSPAVGPFYRISFAWEDRPDVHSVRVSSLRIAQRRRLKSIQTPQGLYTLRYLTDTPMMPSRLYEIQFCVGATCKVPLGFDWTGGGYGWSSVPAYAPLARMDPGGAGKSRGTYLVDVDGDGLLDLVLTPPPPLGTCPASGEAHDRCQYPPPRIWSNRLRQDHGWVEIGMNVTDGVSALWGTINLSDSTKYQVIDMDGDGRADLVAFGAPSSRTVKVALNKPAGWVVAPVDYTLVGYGGTPFGTVAECILRDVNRDGLPDAVCVNATALNRGGVPVRVGAATEALAWWGPSSVDLASPYDRSPANSRFWGDLDGDGRVDMLTVQPLTAVPDDCTGGGLGNPQVCRFTNYFEPNPPKLGIATGAGLVEGLPEYLTALATFRQPMPAIVPNDDNDHVLSDSIIALADLNADGKADAILNHQDGGQLLINSGDTFVDLLGRTGRQQSGGPPGLAVPAVPRDQQFPLDPEFAAFVDLDGDGVTDVVRTRFVSGQPVYEAWRNTFQRPVISLFPNGQAQRTEVHYSFTSQDPSVYDDSDPLVQGTTYLGLPMQVVKSVTAVDGTASGTSDTTYRYFALRGSVSGRGPQGFMKVEVNDHASNTLTTTTYAQAYPYTGVPTLVTKAVGGFEVTRTRTDYCDLADGTATPACTPITGPPNGDPYPIQTRPAYVYPFKVTETTSMWSELNADPAHSPSPMTLITRSTFVYDEYGNQTSLDLVVNGAGESHEKVVLSQYGAPGSDNQKRGEVTRLEIRTQRTAPEDGNNHSITHITEFDYATSGGISLEPTGELVPARAMVKKRINPGLARPQEVHTAYGYDTFGNLTTTTTCQDAFSGCRPGAPNPGEGADALYRTSTVSYDPAAFNAPVGPGLRTSLDYGPGRFPVRMTNAATHNQYSAYEPLTGALIQTTAADGVHTCIEVDVMGRTRSQTQRCGSAPLKTTFDPYLNTQGPAGFPVVTVTQEPTGVVTWNYLDVLGRTRESRTRSFDGDFVQTRTVSYDAAGRVLRETTPHLLSDPAPVFGSSTTYDAIGRVSRITRDLGKLDESQQTANTTDVVTTEYAGLRVTTSHSVHGQIEARAEIKSVAGKTLSVEEGGTKVNFTYDADGNLTSSLDNGGDPIQAFQLEYDLLGRKTVSRDPDMGVWSYEYDGFGDLLKQTDAKHQVTTMTYDVLGRRTSRTDAGGTADWVYDGPGAGIGKLAAMAGAPDPRLMNTCTIPNVTNRGPNRAGRWFSYTPTGEVSQVTECVDGNVFTTDYGYDEAGRQSLITYPQVNGNRLALEYHYTAAGYLQYLADAADHQMYWAASAVNAAGQVVGEYTRNGVTTVAKRNSATGTLMSSSSTAALDGNKLIQAWSYTYDEIGNLMTRGRADRVNASPSTETFGYDQLNRLTSSTVDLTQASYHASDSYSYDTLGNLTGKGGSIYTYGSGCLAGGRAGRHAVCSVTGSAPFGYDDNGNFTSGSGRTVSYNAANKVSQVTAQGGTVTADFIYDADGNRAVQIASGNGDVKRTQYVGLGATGRSLYERTTRGGVVEHVQFFYAGAAHQGNAFALRTTTVGPSTTVATTYQHLDHLGSVTAQSNETGHVADPALGAASAGVMSYDPWGARRNPDGVVTGSSTYALTAGHRGFTGQESIPDVGLINMNGRVLDPSLGRFLTPDPTLQFASNLQSYNRYSYALNNPLRFTDPTGYFISATFDKIVNTVLAIGSLALCPLTGGTTCAVAFSLAAVVYNSASMAYAGASIPQIVATNILGLAGGAVGGEIAGQLGGGVGAQLLGGAVGGALSSGLSTVFYGGDLGRNILSGIAGGIQSSMLGIMERVAVVSTLSAIGDDAGSQHYDGEGGSPCVFNCWRNWRDWGLGTRPDLPAEDGGVIAVPRNGVMFIIRGGTAAEREIIETNLDSILETERGQAALEALELRTDSAGEIIPFRINLTDWRDSSADIGGQFININRRTQVGSFEGGRFDIGPARMIAHELGHAAMKFDQPGAVQFENALMRQLGRPGNVDRVDINEGSYGIKRGWGF